MMRRGRQIVSVINWSTTHDCNDDTQDDGTHHTSHKIPEENRKKHKKGKQKQERNRGETRIKKRRRVS
jgi:hypothetical protein